ncbi:NADP-dependent oxidoreductase domain-containing protein [Tribonema minus]|uniref:NADP-dependent oxidoreductase domain-containing protein n=1 Tax=Tribonema minus TaxID=303371 RepID=A0A835ZCM2_9STRA|nr:NADP-dependent oxidoreductase domain-containing protein [Tribonema minus]
MSVKPFLGVPGPPLGLGLAALGRPGYINLGHSASLAGTDVEVMRAHAWSVLDAAWESGVRYFDAARSYGRAEEFLGGWLEARGIKPEDVAVGSKWGYRYTADWRVDTGGAPHEVKDHSLAHLLSQIHSATLESGVLADEAVLAELGNLKRRGWRIGLSLSGVQQPQVLRLAMQCKLSNGDKVFDCVQATYNLLEQSAGEALLEAKEAMANGRLLPSLVDTPQSRAIAEAAATLNVEPDAVALAAVMAQPFQPMVLSGASNVEQLQSNTHAVAVLEQLQGSELLRNLMTKTRMEPAEYWQERSAMAWN